MASDGAEDEAGFPIVALGASAGGLEALQGFFDHMPADSGLAFVVVTHQHAGHASMMPELLRRHTAIPVIEARDGVAVEPDHVYVEGPAADRLVELERELQHTKDRHQSAVEELETANEELKSTNEELQSTNEELQSANEELETSKEEMQSLNEELQTLNAELHDKVEDLSRANDDMRNLLNGTDIATLFLDAKLHIKRYTEQAIRLIRLIPGDVGRPIEDLVSRLRYDQLVDDARQVLATLAARQVEVQAEDGAWYLMRMLPYRTTENVIDGLVITFVDITEVRGMRRAERSLQSALLGSPTSIYVQDRDLRVTWAWGRLLQRSTGPVVGSTDEDLFGAEQAAALTALKRRVLAERAAAREVLSLTVGRVKGLHDVYVAPDQLASGEVVGVTCVVTRVSAGGAAS